MILACLVATVLTVVLLIPPSAGRSVSTRLMAGGDHRQRSRRPVVALLLGSLAAAGVMVVGGLWAAGPAGAVVGAAVVAAAATGARLLALRRSRRIARRWRSEVARGCATIAAQVRVGRVPGEALGAAAIDWPVLAQVNQVCLLGGDVPDALLLQSRQPGCSGLADLARAWRLAAETGAPMAGVLDQVALALRRDEALQRTVAAELAGPRATGHIMAVLPFCGLGIGYLLGGRPVEFLLQGPLGWACLLGGVLLACAGVLWVAWLARVAEEI